MLKTQINPANLQEMLDSASNATQKGQAQYLTPVPWAQALAAGLPQYRPNLTDLTCGHGTLLTGAAGPSTDYLMGCDIDSTSIPQHQLTARRVTADLTRFFPLLEKVNWQGDLFVLNPPWDLHQYRDRVATLGDSFCPAVRAAFGEHDGRVSRECIDSTVLVLLMALDRCTTHGEGFIIGNQATFDRLILAPNAPHGALRDHIWANVIIPGNICQGPVESEKQLRVASGAVTPTLNPQPSTFRTGILYFARDHYDGFDEESGTLLFEAGVTPQAVGERLAVADFRIQRRGARLRPGLASKESASLWLAAKEEWQNLNPTAGQPPQWNILLGADGLLWTNLSTFDEASGRVNKAEAQRLYQLNGKHPLALVMARETRKELDRAVNGTRWRVAPAVAAAVATALADYNRMRAPLYPLNKIQRLGYVDESDTLLCTKDLTEGGRDASSPAGGRDASSPSNRDASSPGELRRGAAATFIAGQRYELRTESVRVKRSGTKMNLCGALDEVEYEGSELAIFLTSPAGEKLFMEARLMGEDIKLSIQEEGAPSPINFTLQQLVDHFEIPEVPDVATLNPEAYQANLALLHEIEQLVA